MKKIAKILTIVVIFTVFTLRASAAEETDKHIDDFRDILPEGYSDMELSAEGIISLVGPEALLSEIYSAFCENGGEIGAFFLLLLGALALLSLSAFVPSTVSSAVQCGVGAVTAVLILMRLGGVYTELISSLGEMNAFFSALIPVLSAITVAGGGAAAAGVQTVGMNLTLNLFSGLGTAFLSSVVGFGFAMGLLSIFNNEGVASLGRGVRNFFMWMTGIATALIMGTLSLQNIVAVSADSAAMRAAKYMASSSIPVVGGVVAGSLSTLASGLSYAKGIVGAGAVWVTVTMLVIPLVMTLLYRLCISLTASFADFLGISSAARIFGAFRFSLDSVISLYSMSSILYIFEIILFMKSGVAIG